MPSQATRLSVATHQAKQVRRTDAIDGSFTTGGEMLSATFGATATGPTIHVATHGRTYGKETGFAAVSLSSGTISSTAAGVEHIVYYDDLTLKSTHPTFHASTAAAIAQANYAPGRHCLGPITTPTSAGAAASTGGGGTTPPGGGFDGAIP